MTIRIPHIAAALTLTVVAAACGSNGTTGEAGSPESADTVAPPSVESTPPSSGGMLQLDYTAFIAGAIQPSGIGVDVDNGRAVIVTDFERLLVVDLATQEPTVDVGVGRNELPRQGATEGVAFLDDERIAVLYPDARVVGVFDLNGNRLSEVEIPTEGALDGALTAAEGELIVVERTADVATLLRVDPNTAATTGTEIDGLDAPLEGLSPAAPRDGVLGVTAEGEIHRIDLSTGAVEMIGVVDEVDDPSGVEVFAGLEEGEVQIAVTDDADAYNAEPSPLRLYLW